MQTYYYLCDDESYELFELGAGEWNKIFHYHRNFTLSECLNNLKQNLINHLRWSDEYADKVFVKLTNWMAYKNVRLITYDDEIIYNAWCYNNRIEEFDHNIGYYEVVGSRLGS